MPLLYLLISGFASAQDKPAQLPTIRWTEGNPGCTFSRDDDGKYRWALWADDVGIILAVDSQELQMAHRRIQPFLALLLTVRYRGNGTLDLRPQKLTLEFMKHFHVLKHPLESGGLTQQIQRDADETADETERQIEKHPERKEKKEALLHDYQVQAAELRQFVETRSLRAATLGPDRPEVSGWLFFSTRDKWIGDWKNPEEFRLRVPLANRIFEFPFTMPPQKDDLILRRRVN